MREREANHWIACSAGLCDAIFFWQKQHMALRDSQRWWQRTRLLAAAATLLCLATGFAALTIFYRQPEGTVMAISTAVFSLSIALPVLIAACCFLVAALQERIDRASGVAEEG